MVCNIRARLRGRFVIQTVQGSGYSMAEADRRRAAAHLLNDAGITDEAAVRKITNGARAA
jgi:hypothetical protein